MKENDLGGDAKLRSLVFGGPHFNRRATSADGTPVALGAVLALAKAALVANKNLVVRLSDRAHLSYSVAFLVLATRKDGNPPWPRLRRDR
jgi:hypothetical protein